MDKITENANNLAKTLVTTVASSKYIQFVDPTTGAVSNITLANLAKAVADINVQGVTDLTSGGVYESVDLGLPSGTLWAKYNVGATKETEYGDFFAWGATEPYRLNGTTPIDNTANYAKSYANTIQHDLYPNEDAATVKLGKGWIMPTKAQFEELVANTTAERTTIDNIIGHKFTASNGNYIFLPAAGNINGTTLGSKGSYGLYWSRSRSSAENAYRFASGESVLETSTNPRYRGYSVRAVRAL